MEVLGFGLSALGFLATVRNASEKILLDIDAWKKWSQQLVPIISEVECLMEDLAEWQSFWYIDLSRPDTWDLVQLYWGEEGSKSIAEAFHSIRDGAESIKEEFRRLYGSTYKDVRESWRRNLGTKQKLSFEAAARDLESRLVEFRRNVSIWTRARAVLYQNQIFRRNLDCINKDLRRLEIRSQRAFLKKNRAGDEHDWRAKVHDTAAGALLPKLAAGFVKPGEVLHKDLNRVGDNHDILFDLHLDHGMHPEDRQHMLVTSAQNGFIQLHLHVRPGRIISGSEQCLSFRTNIAEARYTESVTHNATAPRPERPAQAVSMGSTATDNDQVEITTWVNNESLKIESEKVQCTCREPRRVLIRARESGRSLLSRKEHIRLTYELVEFAFFFLKSGWLRNLCNCSVHRFGRPGTGEAMFAVSVNCSYHDYTESGTRPAAPWSTTTLPSKQTWRLGLLLTELALGHAVKDVQVRQDGGGTIAILEYNVEKDRDSRRLLVLDDRMDEETELELRDISEDLANTINICLSLASEENEDEEALFRYFYEEAVYPLWRHFDAVVVKPAKDTKLRLNVRAAPAVEASTWTGELVAM